MKSLQVAEKKQKQTTTNTGGTLRFLAVGASDNQITSGGDDADATGAVCVEPLLRVSPLSFLIDVERVGLMWLPTSCQLANLFLFLFAHVTETELRFFLGAGLFFRPLQDYSVEMNQNRTACVCVLAQHAALAKRAEAPRKRRSRRHPVPMPRSLGGRWFQPGAVRVKTQRSFEDIQRCVSKVVCMRA